MRRESLDVLQRNQSINEYHEKGEKMDGRLWPALARVEHGAGPIAGLAVPIFQCAKALRDRLKLVCYASHAISARSAHSWCWYLQVPSEKLREGEFNRVGANDDRVARVG